LDRAALHAYQYCEIPTQIRTLEAARTALDRSLSADQQEHQHITAQLSRLRPNIPYLDPVTALIDLQLYRRQWQRILTSTLYFLKIGTEGLYKIGVTTRSIEERVNEIEADLMLPLGQVKIEVIGTWPSRGNVERYFLHRYAAYRQPLGNLSEYFRLADAKPVIRDLRRMQDKVLSALENQVLAGLPAPAEIDIADLQAEAERQAEQACLEAEHLAEQAKIEAERQAQLTRRSEHIRAGMQRVAALGRNIGRPKGSGVTEAEFMQKLTSQAIRAALDEGLSIRQTAARVGVSVNTVQKVKTLLSK